MRGAVLGLWLLIGAWPLAARGQSTPDHAPVPVLDLQRYAGTWHVLARLSMPVQRDCVRDATVAFAPREDGMLGIRSACLDGKGQRLVEEGVARPVPGAPGSLQVRFAPDWMAWMPLVWKRHWVIAVDEGYRWAMVGSPDHRHLWILAREPWMDPARYRALVDEARRLGYPVDEELVAVPPR
ncbi:MAG TPA: lipocalin family protein [Pseudoxanthomonas sp.]|nr:lipocalin family protein [Pseudoxanthomonas sp.]